MSEKEYNLLMQSDINSNGHTQWFYFQVKNTRKGHNVRFNILNFNKKDSLFNYGMKVSIYSEACANNEKNPLGWFRGGNRFSYFANGIRKTLDYNGKGYYTLSFDYTFQHDDDTVYFAYATPYTYQDCQHDLLEIESD